MNVNVQHQKTHCLVPVPLRITERKAKSAIIYDHSAIPGPSRSAVGDRALAAHTLSAPLYRLSAFHPWPRPTYRKGATASSRH